MAKHVPIAVSCSVGYRSERIAECLRRQDDTSVVNVFGRIFEWVNIEHPAVTGHVTETDKLHTYSHVGLCGSTVENESINSD